MSNSSARSSLGPLFAAGLLCLAAFGSLCAQCHCHGDPSDADDWQRAAEATVEMAEPTDGIAVHPAWSKAPLPDLQPVGNLIVPHEQPLIEDLIGVRQLLVVSESNRRSDIVERLPFDAEVTDDHDFDSVEVLEIPVPATYQIDDDLSSTLDDADVAVVDTDGESRDCRQRATDAGRWRCGDDVGEVRSIRAEIEDQPRRCIRAHPPSGSRKLVVETTVDEPADILRIRAGLDNRAARLAAGDDVIYRVMVDGDHIADEQIDGHRSLWRAHDARTDGDQASLRLEVESVADEPHERRFCFNGWKLTDEQAR